MTDIHIPDSVVEEFHKQTEYRFTDEHARFALRAALAEWVNCGMASNAIGYNCSGGMEAHSSWHGSDPGAFKCTIIRTEATS